jgi:hypothetical protein
VVFLFLLKKILREGRSCTQYALVIPLCKSTFHLSFVRIHLDLPLKRCNVRTKVKFNYPSAGYLFLSHYGSNEKLHS